MTRDEDTPIHDALAEEMRLARVRESWRGLTRVLRQVGTTFQAISEGITAGMTDDINQKKDDQS